MFAPTRSHVFWFSELREHRTSQFYSSFTRSYPCSKFGTCYYFFAVLLLTRDDIIVVVTYIVVIGVSDSIVPKQYKYIVSKWQSRVSKDIAQFRLSIRYEYSKFANFENSKVRKFGKCSSTTFDLTHRRQRRSKLIANPFPPWIGK